MVTSLSAGSATTLVLHAQQTVAQSNIKVINLSSAPSDNLVIFIMSVLPDLIRRVGSFVFVHQYRNQGGYDRPQNWQQCEEGAHLAGAAATTTVGATVAALPFTTMRTTA